MEPALGDVGPWGPWLDLPEGAELDLPGAERVARAGLARVILVAGAPDSGKTTLLAGLYECFQRGPFAGYVFQGSETLSALERRCHLGRIDSGRAAAETARTLAAPGQRWLHLRVRAAGRGAAPRELLVSEVAGETLRLARDSTEECRRLTVSRRADHFVVLVDGARLVHRQQRFAATHDPGMILRAFVDAEMLGRSAFVDVVFTKWDVVLASPAAAEVDEFVAAFAEKTRGHCEARVGRLRFFRVAVRPARGAPVTYGHGLDELFVSWVEASAAFVPAPVGPIPLPEGASEFDRFLWRRLPALRPREAAGSRR
jgi:hypothetical protein